MSVRYALVLAGEELARWRRQPRRWAAVRLAAVTTAALDAVVMHVPGVVVTSMAGSQAERMHRRWLRAGAAWEQADAPAGPGVYAGLAERTERTTAQHEQEQQQRSDR